MAEELPFAERVAHQYRDAPCVFLDCDGVIFDSNGFKQAALRSVLAEYPPAAVDAMELFWTANGGMSRYRKLEHFFREILPLDDVSERVRVTAERFGRLARQAYASAQPVGEALVVARDAGAERCFVVSGADQTELRDIFADKGLAALFGEVCGSPTTKLDHVRRILHERACPPERAIFIGDGGGDFEVGRTLGVPFVYLNQFSEWRDAAAALHGVPEALYVETWPELLALLELTRSSG